jgi:hypothetical protein
LRARHPSFSFHLDWFVDLLRTSVTDRVLTAIEQGAFEFEQISNEACVPPVELERVLARLIKRGLIVERRQGGKTDVARGRRTRLYMPASWPAGDEYESVTPYSRIRELAEE